MGHNKAQRTTTEHLAPGDIVRIDRPFTARTEHAGSARRYRATPTEWGRVLHIHNISTYSTPPDPEQFTSAGVLASDLRYLHPQPALRLIETDWPEQSTPTHTARRFLIASLHSLWDVNDTRDNLRPHRHATRRSSPDRH